MMNYNKYLMKYSSKIRFLTKKCKENQKYIKIAAAVLVVAVAFVFFGDFGEKDTIKVSESAPQEELLADNRQEEIDGKEHEGDSDKGRTEKVTEIIVDISGCVNKPGVYYVNSDSRLCDIISLAGGLTGDADIDSINQAETVSDGQKLYIPSKDDEGLAGSLITGGSNQHSTSSTTSSKVNINTATFDELQTISGIGPATATSIIEYRTNNGRFTCIEDIKNVSGIGEKTFEKLKDHIRV